MRTIHRVFTLILTNFMSTCYGKLARSWQQTYSRHKSNNEPCCVSNNS